VKFKSDSLSSVLQTGSLTYGLFFYEYSFFFQTTDELVVKIVETYDILVKAKASIGAFPFNIHLIVSGLCRTSLPYESQNAEVSFLAITLKKHFRLNGSIS
jgi:hypothetical protein